MNKICPEVEACRRSICDLLNALSNSLIVNKYKRPGTIFEKTSYRLRLTDIFPPYFTLHHHNSPMKALSNTDGSSADNSSPVADCNSHNALTLASCIGYSLSKRSRSFQGTRFRIAAAFRRTFSNCLLSDSAMSMRPCSIPTD